MFNIGDTITSELLRIPYRIDRYLGRGGQADIYSVTDLNSRVKRIFKLIFSSFDKKTTLERIQFLISLNLGKLCRAICAPIDIITTQSRVGHIAPEAPGDKLEVFLQNPCNFGLSFLNGMFIALVLAHVVKILHGRGVSHGDLSSSNLYIYISGDSLEVTIIDLDNFSAPGQPLPPCIGQIFYMAPELRRTSTEGKPAIPDISSDLFSLGVLMHEIILLRHPASGLDNTPEQFYKTMTSGRLPHDRMIARGIIDNIGGYSPNVLNADLDRLFRKSVSLETADRPKAAEWEDGLCQALNHQVYACPSCTGQCLIDASKIVCPYCGKKFPTLKIITQTGRTIPLDKGATVVTRESLGGSKYVSAYHAAFQKEGPENYVVSYGSNGMDIWENNVWQRLPNNTPILIYPGDKLKFGDVEGTVEFN